MNTSTQWSIPQDLHWHEKETFRAPLRNVSTAISIGSLFATIWTGTFFHANPATVLRVFSTLSGITGLSLITTFASGYIGKGKDHPERMQEFRKKILDEVYASNLSLPEIEKKATNNLALCFAEGELEKFLEGELENLGEKGFFQKHGIKALRYLTESHAERVRTTVFADFAASIETLSLEEIFGAKKELLVLLGIGESTQLNGKSFGEIIASKFEAYTSFIDLAKPVGLLEEILPLLRTRSSHVAVLERNFFQHGIRNIIESHLPLFHRLTALGALKGAEVGKIGRFLSEKEEIRSSTERKISFEQSKFNEIEREINQENRTRKNFKERELGISYIESDISSLKSLILQKRMELQQKQFNRQIQVNSYPSRNDLEAIDREIQELRDRIRGNNGFSEQGRLNLLQKEQAQFERKESLLRELRGISSGQLRSQILSIEGQIRALDIPVTGVFAAANAESKLRELRQEKKRLEILMDSIPTKEAELNRLNGYYNRSSEIAELKRGVVSTRDLESRLQRLIDARARFIRNNGNVDTSFWGALWSGTEYLFLENEIRTLETSLSNRKIDLKNRQSQLRSFSQEIESNARRILEDHRDALTSRIQQIRAEGNVRIAEKERQL
ncbi:MAG: hypothetical protein ACOYK9_05575 [Chlamydiia bacterium]